MQMRADRNEYEEEFACRGGTTHSSQVRGIKKRKKDLHEAFSGCTVMAVCKHMMQVGARGASFIFTHVRVELEWYRMTAGQLDSFVLAEAIISIYWQEQLWNSEKADWYWPPRVTNWIEKLRERWDPTTLIDSAVMKHLWGEDASEACSRGLTTQSQEPGKG